MTSLTIKNVPNEVAKGLVEAYPNEEQRNDKILSVLIKLAEEEKRNKITEILDNLELYPAKDKSVVEMVREIREE